MEKPPNKCEVLTSRPSWICVVKSDAHDLDKPVNILISDLFIKEATNDDNRFMQFKNSPTDGLRNKGIHITKNHKTSHCSSLL